MATAAISAEIKDITGVSTVDVDFLASAQKFVVASVPKSLLKWASNETVPATHGGDNDPQQVTLPVFTDSIISVRRDSYPAQEVPIEERAFIDSDASLKKATNTFPKYFIADGNRVIVKPDPDSTYKIYVMYIDYTKIDDDCDLRSAVIFRAVSSEFSKLSIATHTDINTALTAINSQVDSSVTALSNMATEIAKATAEVGDALTEIGEAIGLVDNASNIQVALDAMNTAIDKFRADGDDPALFGDESTYDTGGSGMTKVKAALNNAISLIGFSSDGDKYNANYDLEANMADIDAELTNEDIELASARIQQAQTQMAAVTSHLSIAKEHINEWSATVQTLVAEINAFASEATARYGWISAKAEVWNGELASARGYMETANGYLAQANGFNTSSQAYSNEVVSRISQQQIYSSESAKYYAWASQELQTYIRTNEKTIQYQSQQQQTQAAVAAE